MFSVKSMVRASFLTLLIPVVVACGSTASTTASTSSTTTSDDTSDVTGAASAAGALFGSSSSASLSVPQQALVRFVEQAQQQYGGSPYENDEAYTCASLDSSEQGDQPDNVTTSGYGDPGIYGSDNQNVTVAEEDFCFQSDGTANTGTGPDGNGRFAAFELEGDVDFSCTGADAPAEIVMQAGSSGVFRNTLETADDPAYWPQIYGAFNFLVDGEEHTVNCTIFLTEEQSFAYADCTDENGASVAQEEDTDCSYVPE